MSAQLVTQAAVAVLAVLQADSASVSPGLAATVRNSFVPIAYAALVIVLIGITYLFVMQLTASIRRGDVPRVESHWGGFGGGLGGWQISPSLTYLIAVIVFATLTGMAVRDAAQHMPAAQQTASAPNQRAAAADSTARRQPTNNSAARTNAQQRPDTTSQASATTTR